MALHWRIIIAITAGFIFGILMNVFFIQPIKTLNDYKIFSKNEIELKDFKNSKALYYSDVSDKNYSDGFNLAKKAFQTEFNANLIETTDSLKAIQLIKNKEFNYLVTSLDSKFLSNTKNTEFKRFQSSSIFKYLLLLFEYMGEIFIRLLRMIVVPLVFATIFMSIVKLENIAKIGNIGKKTLLYYLLTTMLAVGLGILLVNIIQPGNLPIETVVELKQSLSIPDTVAQVDVLGKSSVEIIIETLINAIPKNPFYAFANTEILQVIFFSVFLGLISLSIPKETKTLVSLVSGLDQIMQKGVLFIMKMAPIFLFFLVGGIFMKIGIIGIQPLLKYGSTVVLGLFIHGFVTLPLLIYIVTRQNPFSFLRKSFTPLLTAWATSSSAATLPVSIKTMNEEVGIKPSVTSFVLPLGATINMDGTALYESIAVIFIAGILGIDLSIGQQFIIFITASLAAMGAAAIPGAGLVTMGIVLTAVGLPLDAIGIILAIDALLDQFRTMINVWGDCTAAFVINHLEKEDE